MTHSIENLPQVHDLNFFAQIHHVSLGLTHLHTYNVIHGDLKAVNILIDDGPRALLSDFGLSKIKANSNSRLTKAVATPQGSLYWMAPELFQGKRMKLPCDIYAFGMTMFEVVSALSRWVVDFYICTSLSQVKFLGAMFNRPPWQKSLC